MLVEALGSDLLVHFTTDAPRVTVSDAFDGEEDAGLESRSPLGCRRTARGGRRPAAAAGVDLARVHVFDPERGLALR